MKNSSIDHQIRRAALFTDEEVNAMPLSEADQHLLMEILDAEELASQPTHRRPFAGRRPSLRASIGLTGGLVAATCAVALILAVAGGDKGGPTSPSRAWAASDLELANAVPRIAISEPGWKITRADEFSAEQGEFTMKNGSRRVDLFWRPIKQYESWLNDRAHGSIELPPIEILGERVRAFRYAHASTLPTDADVYAALWRTDRVTVEFVSMSIGSNTSIRDQRFISMLKKLRYVSADDWLSAMPDSVVLPGETASTVGEMLKAIPLPDGFDTEVLKSDEAVRDRYQLGAKVAGAVGCAWIQDWLDATAANDKNRAAAAIDAMSTTDRWPVIQQMNREGEYGYHLSQYAFAMANGGVIPDSNGKLTVRETYRSALGCPGG
ncbi:MAG: hypothetical protein HY827_04415 [Actinobacteria bacterium]|nr:hypothetical protein [Actinomycetota bacterium]